MMIRNALLAAVLCAGTMLAACGSEPERTASPEPKAPPAAQPEHTPKPPAEPAPDKKADGSSKPEAGAGAPAGGVADHTYGKAGPEAPNGTAAGPSPSPGADSPGAKPPAQSDAKPGTPSKEAAKPDTNDSKALSWYYLKKKKGEVPGFPAEVKQLKPTQKAVWVGEGKKVYLTIDVGGELLDYKKLLQALKDNDVKATFFVTGYNLKNNPDYIKLLLEEGHTVGNHSITHKDFTTLTDEQVKQEVADFEKLYKTITGQEPTKYFRFPYGKYSMHLLTLLTDLGYTSYFWSTAMKDWEPRKNGAEDPYNDIIGNLHDGNIILMHQASKENIEAMDRILKQIKKEGYEFGTLAELQK